MTNAIERLDQLQAAHLAATGVPHSHLASAKGTGSEDVMAAAVRFFEASVPPETIALAAVARELSRDASPPELYLLVDVAAIQQPACGSLEDAIRAGGGVHAAWQYLRLPRTTHREHPLACRILLSDRALPSRHIEAASRILIAGSQQLFAGKADARSALLRAAIEREAELASTTAPPKRKAG